MKTTKFFKPYFEEKGKDKCTLKNSFEKKIGVYLIKNKEGEIVYVGSSSSNIYKTLYRHFQEWKDKTQYRATYGKYTHTVRIITCTKQQVEKLEKYLIGKMKPVDCMIKYKKYFEDESEKPVYKISKIEEYSKDEVFAEDTPF